MRELIIVGCGIMGATASKYFSDRGVDVLTLDAGLPMAGTLPSGGHLKPSWFGGMSKSEYEPSMQLLDDVWGLEESAFTVWPTQIKTTVFRVDTDVVKAHPFTKRRVVSINTSGKYPVIRTLKKKYQCKNLVITTGHWAGELYPHLEVKKKQGVSFRFSGVLDHPFIKPWAPYKQVVAHQQGSNEIWCGDGSVILEKNWTDERTQQCLERCKKGLTRRNRNKKRTLTGIRPYCAPVKKEDPCFFQQMERNVWLATGAGKSGTISAGWVLKNLIEELKI